MCGPLARSASRGAGMDLASATVSATAIFGKWHLGSEPQSLPTAHGFDQFYGIPPDTSWDSCTYSHPETEPSPRHALNRHGAPPWSCVPGLALCAAFRVTAMEGASLLEFRDTVAGTYGAQIWEQRAGRGPPL
jgi:hypothetical protein